MIAAIGRPSRTLALQERILKATLSPSADLQGSCQKNPMWCVLQLAEEEGEGEEGAADNNDAEEEEEEGKEEEEEDQQAAPKVNPQSTAMPFKTQPFAADALP